MHFPQVRHIVLAIPFVLAGTQLAAQAPAVLMSNGSYSYCNAFFYDSGGATGDYNNNESSTIHFCPGNLSDDPSSAIQLIFQAADLGPGDQIQVYNGNGTGSLIGTFPGVSAAGQFIQSTAPDGCLTVVFTSNGDGATGSGWFAQVMCSTPCTPPTAITDLTGAVNHCMSDALVIDGSGSLPGSPNHPTLVEYLWNLNGVEHYGSVLNTALTEPGVVDVQLQVMDDIGCTGMTVLTVQVPPAPDFMGSLLSDDTICGGGSVDLTGVVNPHTWSNIMDPLVSGVMPLPDGSGVVFNSTINVSGFYAGTAIWSSTDLIEVCMDIEHSFLADLEVVLTGPSGAQVVLFNPAAAGGAGGTNLGEPALIGPGVGWTYCFSATAPLGTIVAENAAGNWVGTAPDEAMPPGTYTPEGTFDDLIGTEINGAWTLSITDHSGSQDGYLFSWNLVFEQWLFPQEITLAPQFDPAQFVWTGSGVSATATDGTATATPTVDGDLPYTFSVTDDFGCTWDTTITLHVDPAPVDFVAASVTLCDNAGTVALFDHLEALDPTTVISPNGAWTGPSGATHPGQFNTASDAVGLYTYTLGAGSPCQSVGTVEVSLDVHSNAGNDMSRAYCTTSSPEDLATILTGSPDQGGTWWDPAGAEMSDAVVDPATMASGAYLHIVPGVGVCTNDTATVQVTIHQAVDAGEDASLMLCRDAVPFSMRSALGGTPSTAGVWTAPAGGVVPDQLDPAIAVPGTYTHTVIGSAPCANDVALLVIDLDPVPVAGGDGSLTLCANASAVDLFTLLAGSPAINGHWLAPDSTAHNGILMPATNASGPYRYLVQGVDGCAHLVDTAVVQITIDPVPVVSFTVEPAAGCAPLEVTLTNTTDPQYFSIGCMWALGDGTSGHVECDAFTHTFTEPGEYSVALEITSPKGCRLELVRPAAVKVDPPPTALFHWTPNPAVPSNSNVVFTALDPYASVFNWAFHDSTYQNERQAVYRFPHALSTRYRVCLDVQDRYGCADTLCELIDVVAPSLFVPNTFTPNNDDINDRLFVAFSGYVQEEFTWSIFDRWGKVVFSTTDPSEGWDGQIGGKDAAFGTYAWAITARAMNATDRVELYGHVTIVR